MRTPTKPMGNLKEMATVEEKDMLQEQDDSMNKTQKEANEGNEEEHVPLSKKRIMKKKKKESEAILQPEKKSMK